MDQEGIVKKKSGRRSIAEVNRIRTAAGLPTYGPTEPEIKIVKEVKVVEVPKIVKQVKVVKVPSKRRGRPRKISIVANTDKARQQQLLAALLHSKGEYIVNQIISKALNDNDKDQIACLKMCVDRIIPTSYFDKAKEAGAKGVTIQIMGVGATEPLLINTSVNEIADAEDIEHENEVIEGLLENDG